MDPEEFLRKTALRHPVAKGSATPTHTLRDRVRQTRGEGDEVDSGKILTTAEQGFNCRKRTQRTQKSSATNSANSKGL